MRPLRALFLTTIVFVTALAGCTTTDDTEPDAPLDIETALADGITTLAERERLPFDVTHERSRTLIPGVFGILDGLGVYVDVPLPVTEGGAALNPLDPPRAHLGLFLPDIPGCDWSAASLPDECKVPVVADAGPYYRTPGSTLAPEGDNPATEPAGRLGGFLIENLVPHGYAVAQISVMGSGLSNHCFDMFGLAEQLGVHHAVEWLGTQPWSNGAVALIGRSYDGSTPWMAAAHGSEHLKTIVPISGLSGLGDLVQWNGAAEARILTFHNVVYGTFGFDDNELVQDLVATASCPDWDTALAWGAASYLTGDDVVAADPAYWHERHFVPRTLANYDGSLYMIHGLQDSNVDPHAGWIAELALRENGNDVKAMWGQWAHMYPDTIAEHGGGDWHVDSIRMDWAQDLLEWFDHYLKGTGPQPELRTEMQQLDGRWRSEAVWPPQDAIVVDLPVGTIPDHVVSPVSGTADFSLGVVSEDRDTLLGGYSTITLAATPVGPGGQVFVELFDATDGSDFGLSYGIMELRHGASPAVPPAPGTALEIVVPFQLFDAVLPAGHELGLRIANSGGGFLPSAVVTPVLVDLSASTLHLSTLVRGDDAYFTPPVWYEERDGEVVQKAQDEGM
jgi:predicted acyl esterase